MHAPRTACAILACLLLAASPALAQRQRPGRAQLSIPDVPRDQVICFALYTVHHKTLKLTAQLYPLAKSEDRRVRLEVRRDGAWQQIAEAEVIEDGWTVPFRVEDWDDTVDIAYHTIKPVNLSGNRNFKRPF